jgi:cysteine sulfinate desulfinase/cysteine desulfurase-like protein
MGRVRPGDAAIRFSLGHTTTMEDIDVVLNALPMVVQRVRMEVNA